MSPLRPDQPLALFMEGALGDPTGKMGYGVLRYSPNPIRCVIDSNHVGEDGYEVAGIAAEGRTAPIVSNIREAVSLDAEVFVLGIAPGGGSIPEAWYPAIDEAVASGLSVVNGLHDLLGPRYPNLRPGQFVWDIRIEPANLTTGKGEARKLSNRRVLMIGTDMSVGKMTAGLEIHKEALRRGIRSAFVATGQIGITITGAGVPLDAVRVDFASGAIEREVLAVGESDLVIVEGQGSLLHPGSTATLPLLRGSCPTHLVLCHRAGMNTLQRADWVAIPNLERLVDLYEELAETCGTYPRPKTAAIALVTADLGPDQASDAIARVAAETGLPVSDPVREGGGRLLEALLREGA